jgi:c-di-AMP phosphodiesterase-like protein
MDVMLWKGLYNRMQWQTFIKAALLAPKPKPKDKYSILNHLDDTSPNKNIDLLLSIGQMQSLSQKTTIY